jgi:hypothetical protein
MTLATIFAISGAWVGLSLAVGAVVCCFAVFRPSLESEQWRQDKSNG